MWFRIAYIYIFAGYKYNQNYNLMDSNRAYLKLGNFEELSLLSLQQSGYELANFEYSFNQGLDVREQPATRVHGGAIKMLIPSLPSREIADWGMKARRYHKGAIVVFGPDDIAIEKILFDNAACVHFDVVFCEDGDAYIASSLHIYAEKIKFGQSSIDFNNNWTKV